MKYNENKFTDGTFYITPKFSYQVFITRTYIKDLNANNSNTIITPINFNLISKMTNSLKL
ncbi:hypothetical protein H8356DRAFT_1358881 [Neocallimastix lanati (nom. inval.)]|nr:hypothetical protein H8356DRAFT_1358881 [Neocallimastix sp. JGI-2020a]